MLLLRHGFLWFIVLDDKGSINHELRLNSVEDNWSAEFSSDWLIPSYLQRQILREDDTSVVWGNAVNRNNDIMISVAIL